MKTTCELPVPEDYALHELFGEAWEKAIFTAAEKLGLPKRSVLDRWGEIQIKANKKNFRFDQNGNLVKED